MNKQFAISIIHPTARVAPPYPSFPTGWLESCEQFLWRADHPEDIEYVLSVHESNWKVFAETWTGVTGPGQWSGSLCPAVDGWGSFKLVKSTKRNCVIDNGQAACEAATGLIFMGSMDDLFPPKHWDTLLLQAFQRTLKDVGEGKSWADEPAVLHVRTGSHMDDLVFIPQIFTKALFDAQGYALHPSYETGMFADNEFTDVAKRDGIVIKAPHITFAHRHPAFGTAKDDSVYREENADKAYSRGLHNYEARKALDFPKENVDLQKATGRKILALCLPGESFSSAWVYHLAGLLGYMHNQFIVIPYFGYASDPYITRQGMLEGILKDAQESGNVPDYVLWLDDDNLLTWENFARLLRNLDAFNMDVVAGWCHIQGNTENTEKPLISCGLWPEGASSIQHLTQAWIDMSAMKNELIPVDWTGFPCVLMRYSVLERAEDRPFLNILEPTFKWGKAGEDISFCRTIKQRAGIQIYVDPCVHVPHLKVGEAGRNYYGGAPKQIQAAGLAERFLNRVKQLVSA